MLGYRLILVAAALVLFGLSSGGYGSVAQPSHATIGGQSGQSSPDMSTPTVTKENQTEGLDPALHRLTNASSPEMFASDHGLDVQGQSVLVVIESSTEQLPTGYNVQVQTVSVDSNNQTLIQGRVLISELRPLAQEPSVSYVRPPREGIPDEQQQMTPLNNSISKENRTEGLDPVLNRLRNASSPDIFASDHGLDVQGQSVLVVIESSTEQLPAGYNVQVQTMSVNSNNQTLIQGYVPISELRPLAQEPTVSYIRPPKEGIPDEQQQLTPSDDSSNFEDGSSAGDVGGAESGGATVVVLGVVLFFALAAVSFIYKNKG